MSEEDDGPNRNIPQQNPTPGADPNVNEDTFMSKVVHVIHTIRDMQLYTPTYISATLEKVIEVLYMFYPLSPPPESLEVKKARHANGGGVCSAEFHDGLTPGTSSDSSAQPDMLGTVLTAEKNRFSQIPPIAVRSTSEKHKNGPPIDYNSYVVMNIEMPNIYGWNFDIFQLEAMTGKRALVCAGMKILPDFKVDAELKIPTGILQNWVILMEANYHEDPPYHNNTHAADVLQATAYFLKNERLISFMDSSDHAICLLSAIAHDVDHPGKTNAHLVAIKHELAMLYNDKAVLESHHVAFMYKLTLSDPRVNIFQNLDPDKYRKIRNGMVDAILATEMVQHYHHVTEFTAALKAAYPAMGSAHDVSATADPFKTGENVALTRRMLIKCADVSNPTRPLRLTGEWALRICEEFFRQTEDEVSKGQTATLPYFNRKHCSVPTAQTGFNDFFTLNLFTPWNEFLRVNEVMGALRQNDEFWRELEKKGISTAIQVAKYFREEKPGADPQL